MEHADLMASQDDVLMDLTTGALNENELEALPPWRAVLLARVAVKTGAMEQSALELLIHEAGEIGGAGDLRTTAGAWRKTERPA